EEYLDGIEQRYRTLIAISAVSETAVIVPDSLREVLARMRATLAALPALRAAGLSSRWCGKMSNRCSGLQRAGGLQMYSSEPTGARSFRRRVTMFARQNQGRAAPRNLATMRPRQRAARLWQSLPFTIAAVLAGVVALPQSALGAVAAPGVTFT